MKFNQSLNFTKQCVILKTISLYKLFTKEHTPLGFLLISINTHINCSINYFTTINKTTCIISHQFTFEPTPMLLLVPILYQDFYKVHTLQIPCGFTYLAHFLCVKR